MLKCAWCGQRPNLRDRIEADDWDQIDEHLSIAGRAIRCDCCGHFSEVSLVKFDGEIIEEEARPWNQESREQ